MVPNNIFDIIITDPFADRIKYAVNTESDPGFPPSVVSLHSTVLPSYG